MPLFKKGKLIEAVLSGDLEGARKLLDAGVSGAVSKNYHPVILHAIENQDTAMTALLLEHGADLHARCSNHGGALDVLQGKRLKADFIAFLLEKDPSFLQETPNMNGLLHLAVQYGAEDTVELLLAKGARREAPGKDGATAGYLAKRNGFSALAKRLDPRPPLTDSPPAWSRLSGERVAEVAVDAVIGYKLTEIFNFETRERISISRNLETDAETRETKAFDDIPDKAVLERAHAAYAATGGSIEKEVVYGRSELNKPTLRLGQTG